MEDRSSYNVIMLVIKLGRRLQIDHPEIADVFRSGIFFTELASKYNVLNEYNIRNERIAANAIMYAIKGYDGQVKGIDAYCGLITDESELERLLDENRRRYGQVKLDEGLGIFNRRNRNAWTLAILAKGCSPWTKGELYDAKRKVESKKYRTARGPNYSLITNYLNNKYHSGEQVRSINAVKLQVSRYRRRIAA